MDIVTYLIASDTPLPPIQAAMYEYVVAANGVFVRGRRDGLCVTVPVVAFPPSTRLRGLVEVEPFFTLDFPRVPADQVRSILEMSLAAQEDACPVEALFHLAWNEGWQVHVPPQVRTPASVRPERADSIYARTLVEVHSHHEMKACFSPTDDADEQGFRIYAVLGQIYTRPVLRVRVGLYGHFWQVPADWVFQLPEGILAEEGSQEAQSDALSPLIPGAAETCQLVRQQCLALVSSFLGRREARHYE